MNISDLEKRQALRNKYKGEPLTSVAVERECIDKMLNCTVDHNRLKRLRADYIEPIPSDMQPKDAQELINELREQFTKQRYYELLDNTRKEAINSIVGPLGLGKVLAIFDKNGGNVTTIHNAQKGIYARTQDEYHRKEYTDSANSEGKRFSGNGKNSAGAEFTRKNLDSNGYLKDGYTGKRIKGSESSPNHVISLSEAHKNGGFMVSSERKADIATDKDNLVSTRRDINQSMKDHDKMEWADSEQGGRDISNAEHFDIERDLLGAAYKKGREATNKHLPSDVEKTVYYTVNSAKTGCTEGAKMGVQQALGLLLSELINSIFNEVKDMFVNGFGSEDFLQELNKRLKNIALSVSGRWKDAVKGFREGFFSGFISNLITTIINTVATTGKKFVRMIREGIFSLFKAMKMIFFPPEGMTSEQAKHEGLKLILSGAVVVGSLVVSEIIEKSILTVPVLAPFAPTLSAMLTGLISGMSIAIGCYLLDKMDIWGAIAIEEHNFVMRGLLSHAESSIAACEKMDKEFDNIYEQFTLLRT